MEAIILAGGFGTRLRPLTYTKAKPLLPILNKPMISYIADQLPPEVDTVILAVNYRKEQIEDYFSKHDFGRTLIVNDEPEPLGTGGATKFAEEHITGPFLVLNSDIISSLDINKMIQYHKEKNAIATISLWPVQHVSEFGVVDIDTAGKINNFVEKPKPEDAPSNLINAGAYYLEPEVLDYIEPGKLISMEKQIFPQLIKDTDRFYGYQLEGFWMDVGRITSYLEVHQLLLKQRNLQNLIGEHAINQGTLKGTTVGSHVTIGQNTTIENSILLNGAQIADDCIITNSVIGEGAIIAQNSTLNYVVVGDNERIPGTTLHDQLIWNQPVPEGYPKKQIGNVIGE